MSGLEILKNAVFHFEDGASGVDLHFTHAVTGAKDFDAEERGRPDDRTGGSLSDKYRDVGNPVPPGFDLNACLGYGQNTPLLFAT